MSFLHICLNLLSFFPKIIFLHLNELRNFKNPKLTWYYKSTILQFFKKRKSWGNGLEGFSWLSFPGGSDGKKNLPAAQETWVRSLGQEDPLEKEMATYSRILVWQILWTEEPGRLQSLGLQRLRQDWVTNTFTFIFPGYLMCFEV